MMAILRWWCQIRSKHVSSSLGMNLVITHVVFHILLNIHNIYNNYNINTFIRSSHTKYKLAFKSTWFQGTAMIFIIQIEIYNLKTLKYSGIGFVGSKSLTRNLPYLLSDISIGIVQLSLKLFLEIHC